MATLTITPQLEIPAGTPNAAQLYNDNVEAANANDEALATEVARQAGQPTVRSVNGRFPASDGSLSIVTTGNSEPMSQAQRDALPLETLTVGRKIYNTTIGREQVYGNHGWEDSGSSPAPVTTLAYTSGVLTTLTEKTAGGTVLSTTTLQYTGGVLTSVVETAGSVTRTTTLQYTGGVLTGLTYS